MTSNRPDQTPEPQQPWALETVKTTRFDQARHEQKIGFSVDSRLFFRKDKKGGLYASVVWLQHSTGARLRTPDDEGTKANFRLKTPADVEAFYGEIAKRGFDAMVNRSDTEWNADQDQDDS